MEVVGWKEIGADFRGLDTDSWAAAWQARYMGFVPKGSLWSYLQRLGMTWKLV